MKRRCDKLMLMKNMYTVTTDSTIVEVMRQYYAPYMVTPTGEYVDFQAECNNATITCYLSNKNRKKIVFSGEGAYKEAKIWNPDLVEEKEEQPQESKKGWIYFDDQIGSDEVGVGDFLGPMIVVAAFVSKNDIARLKEYGIQDSKKMSDEKILELGPKLAKEFHYSKLTLPNTKYSEMIEKGENLNSLKAKMHNRALLNMHKQFPDVINIFVDQFVAKDTYYKYLNDKNEEQVKDICFKTKGESYFPSVALASVLARYSFLLEMKKQSEKYGMEIPFGASKKVDTFVAKFIEKYGLEELTKIAKTNFANYKKLLEK